MPTFRVSFRSAQSDELINADDVRMTSSAYEFLRETTVMGRPRTVVARRVPVGAVDDVTVLQASAPAP